MTRRDVCGVHDVPFKNSGCPLEVECGEPSLGLLSRAHMSHCGHYRSLVRSSRVIDYHCRDIPDDNLPRFSQTDRCPWCTHFLRWIVEQMTSSCRPTNENAKLSIQTSRLILREARPTDLDDLHVLFSQDDAMKYW